MLHARAIRTPLFRVGQPLAPFVLEALKTQPISEKTIVCVTSKIVSLSEKRIVPRSETDKRSLILREADHDLGEIAHGVRLTIKHGLMIPSAGIDESNSESGDFILFPQDPYASARQLWKDLRVALRVRELGVLITDSRTQPLRWGVTGIALSYWGFRAIRDLVGTDDLFGRKLQMTKVNAADALASTAAYLMGESDDRCPIAVIEGSDVVFSDQSDPSELMIPLERDLYYPLIRKALPE